MSLTAARHPSSGIGAATASLARWAFTPLVPGDYLDLVAPLRAGADLRGRVVAITPQTPDAVTITIRAGRGWAGHVPGQYIRIGVDVDGVRQWRAYSLTSTASTSGRSNALIAITVKAIPNGTVSTHLVRRLTPGTLIHLDQAAGDFVLGDHRGPTLFVTAGSGITPVMGMLRNQLATLSDVVLVHSAPTPQDVIFGAELRQWHHDGRLHLIERHTDRDGVLLPADLGALVPDWATRQTWACGPTGMLDAFEEHWTTHDRSAQLHTERFRPRILIQDGGGGAVTFTRSRAVVEADGGTPLLDAGERAGVLMPSGCRMGICFGCVVPLREGTVRDLRNGALTTATDPADGVRIQTCVSAAAGPCEIDL